MHLRVIQHGNGGFLRVRIMQLSERAFIDARLALVGWLPSRVAPSTIWIVLILNSPSLEVWKD